MRILTLVHLTFGFLATPAGLKDEIPLSVLVTDRYVYVST